MRFPSRHFPVLSWIRAPIACAVAASMWACSDAPAPPGQDGADGAAPRGAPTLEAGRADARPPVVLVVVDALRADRLDAGGEEALAPTLDAIAREGVVVERALAPAPWSQPSIASLFTGLYPGVHGVTRYETAFEAAVEGHPATRVFPDRFRTLAEVLRDAGYETAAFVANPFVAASFGFDQGFDHYASPPPGESWRGDQLADAATAWLDGRDTSRPPFLYLHFMDVHGPWDAAPSRLEPLIDAVDALDAPRRLSVAERERLGYLGRLPRDAVDPARHARLSDTLEYWRARYDGAVRELDAHLGALVAALRKRGLWDASLVIVTADHGEALLDGGRWGHGGSVQDAELRVPLVWRWPQALPAGASLEATAGLVDVLPTVADLLGLDPPDGIQGRSLASALRAGSGDHLTPVPLFAEAVRSGPAQEAVYRGRYKLVRVQHDDDGAGPVDHLFDLDGGDAPEHRDVGAQRPEVRRALAAALDAHLRADAVRAEAPMNVAAPPAGR